MSYYFRCPHCFTAINHRRNLLAHFQSNPGCPWQNPDYCIVENSIDGSSASPPLEEGPPSPPLWIVMVAETMTMTGSLTKLLRHRCFHFSHCGLETRILRMREDTTEWSMSTHVDGHTHINRVVCPNFVSQCKTDVFEDGEDKYAEKAPGLRRCHCKAC